MKDSFKLGNKEFNSRFILGSGKYSNELINSAIKLCRSRDSDCCNEKSYQWSSRKYLRLHS